MVTTSSGGGVPLGRVIVDGAQTSRRPANGSHHRPLQEAIPVDPPSCDDSLTALICGECIEGIYSQIDDDERCGVISCAAFEGFPDRGHQQLGRATARCIASVTEISTTNRCAALGECIEANSVLCPTTDDTSARSRPLRKDYRPALAHLNSEIAPTVRRAASAIAVCRGIVSKTKNLSRSLIQSPTPTQYPPLLR